METSKCAGCGASLSLAERTRYAKRSAPGRPYCRQCATVRQREWFARNNQVAREVTREPLLAERRAEMVARLAEYIRARGCADCGETAPACLDFETPDGRRRLSPASLIGARPVWKRVQASADACTVRCANCARKRAADARGHYDDAISTTVDTDDRAPRRSVSIADAVADMVKP